MKNFKKFIGIAILILMVVGMALAVTSCAFDCPSCDGTGKCVICNGTGKESDGSVCRTCKGTGICKECDGTGKK
jgi:hypothetical protein